MTSATWTAIRRRCPMLGSRRLYRWVCRRQHEAMEREKFERVLRMAIGEARRVRL